MGAINGRLTDAARCALARNRQMGGEANEHLMSRPPQRPDVRRPKIPVHHQLADLSLAGGVGGFRFANDYTSAMSWRGSVARSPKHFASRNPRACRQAAGTSCDAPCLPPFIGIAAAHKGLAAACPFRPIGALQETDFSLVRAANPCAPGVHVRAERSESGSCPIVLNGGTGPGATL